jgi:hypothetical protein
MLSSDKTEMLLGFIRKYTNSHDCKSVNCNPSAFGIHVLSCGRFCLALFLFLLIAFLSAKSETREPCREFRNVYCAISVQAQPAHL